MGTPKSEVKVETAETAKQAQVPSWVKGLIATYRYPRKVDDVQPVRFGLTDPTDDKASPWTNAVKVMNDVWKNEETRFNNITSRGATMLGGTSLIATLLGYISKGLFTGTADPLEGDRGDWVKALTVLALLAFASTVGVLVFGVLLPRGRFVFGDNKLVGTYDRVDDTVSSGSALSSVDIDREVAGEYAGMYVALANRSRRKAYWLNIGYTTFAAAIAVSFVIVLILVLA